MEDCKRLEDSFSNLENASHLNEGFVENTTHENDAKKKNNTVICEIPKLNSRCGEHLMDCDNKNSLLPISDKFKNVSNDEITINENTKAREQQSIFGTNGQTCNNILSSSKATVLNDTEQTEIHENAMIELQNKLSQVETQEEKTKTLKNQPLSHGNNDNDYQGVQLSVECMDPDTICGIGKFQPQWLQEYATAKSYLILYSAIGVIQGSYFTYLIGTLTTLEKRYSFKSKISGSIMMFDEITPLLLGVLIGYFGGRMHKPRVLAVGMCMSALCCFVSALPYFIYGTSLNLVVDPAKNETGTEYCDLVTKHEKCDEEDKPSSLIPVVCLFVGSFLKGFGNLAYYAVGLSYLDDVSKKKNTPIYFAIFEALRLAGPILGFLMSSAFLKYYENPMGDPGYGPDDPRWIGAWWLGFVLQGILLIIITSPILLFPKRLPKQRVRTFSNTANFNQETNREKLLGMIKALKRLLTNPFYIIFVFATIFSAIGAIGFYIMLPKYMEIQFHLSASDANIFSGPPALVGMQCVIVLGGWVIWKFRPSARTLLAGQASVEFVWALGMVALIIPSCHHYDMPGTALTEYGLDIDNECNADCLCSTRSFSPVCGPDGVSNYFSPCHAGCKVQNYINNTAINNCSCLYNSDGIRLEANTTIKNGLCKTEGCWDQALIYIIIFPILVALTSSLTVVHVMVLLRCIEVQDKSIALGLFEALLSALAFIPYPLIYGSLVDSACLVWETSCGQTGNCWYYDIDKFNYLIHGCSSGFALSATICFSIICFMSHRVRDLYNDDEEMTCENLTMEKTEHSTFEK